MEVHPGALGNRSSYDAFTDNSLFLTGNRYQNGTSGKNGGRQEESAPGPLALLPSPAQWRGASRLVSVGGCRQSGTEWEAEGWATLIF